ncbi:MAG: 2OG-Fe(II) oxygenase [Phaeodactylibacter sp.]|nr:2OG-Fe(II) oxygenase [Phaeodactylibacter sp.]
MDIQVQSNEQLFEALITGLLTQGYAVADGFLSPPEALAILDASTRSFEHGGFSIAGIGKSQHYQLNRNIRGDHIKWLDHHNPPEACLPFFTRLQEMIHYFNRNLYLGIRDMELHFAVYPEGAFYKRHLDVFRHTKARKVSIICYLNANWLAEDGGQLRLYLPGEDGTERHEDILPMAGRLVCFNSQSIEHEVLPARRRRYSITGWLKDEQSLFDPPLPGGY